MGKALADVGVDTAEVKSIAYVDAFIRWIYHIDPNGMNDFEWALKFRLGQDLLKKYG